MRSGSLRGRSWKVGVAATALFGGMALTNVPASAVAPNVSDLFELDGNPAATSGAPDDWADLLSSAGTAPGFVAKTSMPIVDSDSPTDVSYYTGGGSKDVRDVPDWQYSSGDVAPDKDEILNAFAAAYKTGAATDTNRDLILYFGSDRFANNGDSQMGFWFFKNEVSLDGAGHFNGVHTAKAAATSTTPAHGGDILVLSDFSGGGSVSTINVYEWVGGKNPLTHIAAGNGSVDCDVSTHNANVCAIENESATAAAWTYVPKAGASGTYPIGSFLEGGINVSQLIPGSDQCFASFLAETRSSTSTTAQLKDFALGKFPICAPTTTMADTATTASPAVVLSGGSATFTFKERNDGDLPLSDVKVSLSPSTTSCGSELTTYTGDDGNAKLDPGETFTFTCQLSGLTADATLTGTGHGKDFRNKDVTYCTTPASPPDNTVCDQDERAAVAVDVIAPSTTMASSSTSGNPSTIHVNTSSTFTFRETNDGTGGTAAQLVLDNPHLSFTGNGASDCIQTVAYTGDDDSDGDLDVGETWVFTCSVSPTAAGTVSVTATGHGDIMGHDVTYCATAGLTSTQVCDPDEQATASVSVINPGTTLKKTASAFVTYTYTETNDAGDGSSLRPPVATDRNSLVVDDNCSAVTYVSGDTGNDKILSDGETWTFTCTATVAGPTTDTGSNSVTNTATGHGIDATGSDVTYCANINSPPASTFCDQQERDRVTVAITNSDH
jgi:hypothetical protein